MIVIFVITHLQAGVQMRQRCCTGITRPVGIVWIGRAGSRIPPFVATSRKRSHSLEGGPRLALQGGGQRTNTYAQRLLGLSETGDANAPPGAVALHVSEGGCALLSRPRNAFANLVRLLVCFVIWDQFIYSTRGEQIPPQTEPFARDTCLLDHHGLCTRQRRPR